MFRGYKIFLEVNMDKRCIKVFLADKGGKKAIVAEGLIAHNERFSLTYAGIITFYVSPSSYNSERIRDKKQLASLEDHIIRERFKGVLK
jgi:hypothetical protein